MAFSGTLLGTGAIREDSAATGIGDDESNNDPESRGAAYVWLLFSMTTKHGVARQLDVRPTPCWSAECISDELI